MRRRSPMGSGFWIQFVAASVLVLAAVPVTGQEGGIVEHVVTLMARDQEGNRHAVRVGVHSHATTGFDAQFAEVPVPPVPSVPAFDLRILDPTRIKGKYAGLDSYNDLRGYTSTAQADTFVVRFQPANNAYPVLFSWDSAYVANRFRGATLAYRSGDQFTEVDMRARDTVSVGLDAGSIAIVVLRGPAGPVQEGG